MEISTCYPTVGCTKNQDGRTAMNDGITIGMDLGNKKHKAVGMDSHGKVVFRVELPNTLEELRAFFGRNGGATVGMETGTHCRWISALAREMGCRSIVGNARKLRLIFESSRKNDWRDAETLAELCRTSKTLFHPVELRSNERHKLFQMLKVRDALVTSRTRMVNSLRGLCKANGVILPKCDAAALPRHAGLIPEGDRGMFEPLLAEIDALSRAIREYDFKIEEYVDGHFKEDVGLLRTIPGVGLVTGASFVANVPAAGGFARPRDAGPYFGLVPRLDQSGDSDNPRHISKEGNDMVRRNLVTAANYIMREASRETELKRFGMRIAGPGKGKVAKRRAKTALARKLAVTMAAMLKNRTPYNGAVEAGKTA